MKETEDFKKPAYDGRQHYYTIMFGHLFNASDSLSNGDLLNAWRGLRLAYGMNPYLKGRHELKVKLNQIHTDIITMKKNGIRDDFRVLGVEVALYELFDELHDAAKHMLLPVGMDEDSDDWDFEEFERRSGI